MSEVVRIYRYKSLLDSRRSVSAEELMSTLEISRATLKRDIAKLRDQLNVPIVFDRDLGGYALEKGQGGSELPGLWFSQEELLALITVQQLMGQLEPSLLGAKLKPLQTRLERLMENSGLASADVAKRIRIVNAGKRTLVVKSFEAIAAATMARKRLKLWHLNRQNGITTEREVSPQRLVHYRDNWYLDAWCHLRDDVRSFSIDAVSRVEVMEENAKEVASKRIDDTLGAAHRLTGPSSGSPQRGRGGSLVKSGILCRKATLRKTAAMCSLFRIQMTGSFWGTSCGMGRMFRS